MVMDNKNASNTNNKYMMDESEATITFGQPASIFNRMHDNISFGRNINDFDSHRISHLRTF